MKRFWCSVCNKIKHVRVMPDNVVTPLSDKPAERIGTCRWHDSKIPRGKVHVGKHIGSTRRVSASSAKTKSKKG